MLPAVSPPRALERSESAIPAFASATQEVILETAPRSENLALYVVLGMIVVGILAMSLIPIDRVVASQGRILPEGGSLFVQPLDRAIVSQIVVHPGDVVRKGQTLALLDPTFATADFLQLQQKRASAAALVARLEAEQNGRSYAATDPKDPSQELQASIYLQRRSEFQQGLADYDARIAASESVLRKAEQDAENDSRHVGLASQLADMQSNLVKKGWGSQALVLSSTDTRVQAERQLAESRNTANQAQHDLASLRAQKADYVSKWRGDLGVSLVTARNDLHEAEETFAKASKMHDLSRLTAPADAVVLSIGKASAGSVVDPNGSQTPLFTLTPLSDQFVAELNVAARDIGFIRKGDKVRLKVDAFRFTAHGTAMGVVQSISDGSFTQGDDGQPRPPFYRVKVKITETKLRNVPKDAKLLPGMTLQGDILIGGRTMMSYLMEGALRTGTEAMREP